MKDALLNVDTLRSFIRHLWDGLENLTSNPDDALKQLDELYDTEVRGACRSEILDILDKALMCVGGGEPSIVEEPAGERTILFNRCRVLREKTTDEINPNENQDIQEKIIQLPRP